MNKNNTLMMCLVLLGATTGCYAMEIAKTSDSDPDLNNSYRAVDAKKYNNKMKKCRSWSTACYVSGAATSIGAVALSLGLLAYNRSLFESCVILTTDALKLRSLSVFASGACFGLLCVAGGYLLSKRADYHEWWRDIGDMQEQLVNELDKKKLLIRDQIQVLQDSKNDSSGSENKSIGELQLQLIGLTGIDSEISELEKRNRATLVLDVGKQMFIEKSFEQKKGDISKGLLTFLKKRKEERNLLQ
jgi:hypothetical protein